MTKAMSATWRWILWLLLGSDVGSGTVANNAFGVFRTIMGMPIEVFVIKTGIFQNISGRALSGVYDVVTNAFFETLRYSLRESWGIKKGPKSWAFDTVYMITVKTPGYIGCLYLTGIPWETLRWVLALNIVTFGLTAAINCHVIDLWQEKYKKDKA